MKTPEVLQPRSLGSRRDNFVHDASLSGLCSPRGLPGALAKPARPPEEAFDAAGPAARARPGGGGPEAAAAPGELGRLPAHSAVEASGRGGTDLSLDSSSLSDEEGPVSDLLVIDHGADRFAAKLADGTRWNSCAAISQGSLSPSMSVAQGRASQTTTMSALEAQRLRRCRTMGACSCSGRRARRLAACLLLCLLLVSAAAAAFVLLFGRRMGDAFMLYQDYPSRGDPGYLVDFFGPHCLYLKRTFSPVLKELEAYNLRRGWKEVTLPAREDSLPVRALVFPAASSVEGAEVPRVVLAHGGHATALDSSVQAAAYYLRLANISAVVPFLRGGAGRGHAQLRAEWQHQARDLLGAWDYAVADPEGLLGGRARPGRRAGLLCFGVGCLAAQEALALEPEVPALLMDGALHDVREAVAQRVRQAWPAHAPELLAPLVAERAWERCQALAGRPLDASPSHAELLISRGRQHGGTLGIIHSVNDSVILVEQRDRLLASVRAASPPGFELALEWYPSFSAGGACAARREAYLEQPAAYLLALCSFWRTFFDAGGALAGGASRCEDAAALVR
ncbi:unnamed protein product [Prorocentrum cordatum]|uniref:1-alkyl-2-acetylglycerophosphocholine esterase n=1 Tax=Prorocentrum cordatum TaxID=2364126 RepID=A0ABN9WEM9_9DINO|nr:unnamed protein product [Polarella glacialis]